MATDRYFVESRTDRYGRKTFVVVYRPTQSDCFQTNDERAAAHFAARHNVIEPVYSRICTYCRAPFQTVHIHNDQCAPCLRESMA